MGSRELRRHLHEKMSTGNRTDVPPAYTKYRCSTTTQSDSQGEQHGHEEMKGHDCVAWLPVCAEINAGKMNRLTPTNISQSTLCVIPELQQHLEEQNETRDEPGINQQRPLQPVWPRSIAQGTLAEHETGWSTRNSAH